MMANNLRLRSNIFMVCSYLYDYNYMAEVDMYDFYRGLDAIEPLLKLVSTDRIENLIKDGRFYGEQRFATRKFPLSADISQLDAAINIKHISPLVKVLPDNSIRLGCYVGFDLLKNSSVFQTLYDQDNIMLLYKLIPRIALYGEEHAENIKLITFDIVDYNWRESYHDTKK